MPGSVTQREKYATAGSERASEPALQQPDDQGTAKVSTPRTDPSAFQDISGRPPKNAASSSMPPRAVRPPSPLTNEKLERLPGYSLHTPDPGTKYNIDGNFAYSTIGNLQSTEHAAVASRASKLEVINQAALAINGMPADKPLTVVSVGSGHLLPEHLIHNQLTEKMRAKLSWRCIDPIYAQTTTEPSQFEAGRAARVQFGKDKSDARAFSTPNAYLSKMKEGKRLVDQDIHGSVMILAIDPPTVLPSQWSKVSAAQREHGILIKGKVLQEGDIKKANTILLTLAKNNAAGKQMLQSFAESLKGGIGLSQTTVKCFPNKDGKFEFEFAGGINESLKPVIISRTNWHTEKMPIENTPIEKLHLSIKACISELEHANKGVIATATIFSDYDRGVDELVESLSSATGAVAIAKLENSTPEVRHIKTSKVFSPSGAAAVLNQKSGQAPGMPAGGNSFDADPAYVRMNSGHPENGIVVHLPNIHIHRNAHDIDHLINQQNLPQFFASELNVLKVLRAKDAKHVFAEGIDEHCCNFYNGASAVAASNAEFKSVCDQFTKIASGIDEGKSAEEIFRDTSSEAKKWFLDMGGAAVHVILSQANASPAHLYVTSSPELQAMVSEIQANATTSSGELRISNEQKEFLFETREDFVAREISRASLEGHPAFVTFGPAHTFEKAFSGANAPALYRLATPEA